MEPIKCGIYTAEAIVAILIVGCPKNEHPSGIVLSVRGCGRVNNSFNRPQRFFKSREIRVGPSASSAAFDVMSSSPETCYDMCSSWNLWKIIENRPDISHQK